MDEVGKTRRAQLREKMMTRLASRWPVLLAAVGALALVSVFDGSGWLLAAGGAAVVLLVTLLASVAAPKGVSNSRPPVSEASVDILRAIDLATAVPDPLIMFDGRGAVLHANPAAASAFGEMPRGIALQLKFRAPEMQELVRTVLAGQPVVAPTEYAEKVPVERVYRVSVMPVGRAPGVFVMLFRDQSESKRIDRMRADFIANASHELRTPLASVTGFIETLRGPARDDAAARDSFLEIMQDQTARMARLIDDLLSLSRLEMKPYLKPDERVDLRAIVGGVIDTLANQAREADVTVERVFPDEPTEIAGNRDELVQIFENLLENAIKYGGDGGRVVVSVEHDEDEDGEARVSVRDFGPGIPEEHIPRITERFYRVDAEASRARKGTGLGLSIVKHILSRHGARLTVSSRAGEGATFTAHFPFRN